MALLMALILTAALMTSWQMLLPIVVVGMLCALGAGLSPWQLLKRLVWLLYLGIGLIMSLPLAIPGAPVLQFAVSGWVLTASREGMAAAGLLCLRMLGCFLPALAIAVSTPFPQLLEALGSYGVPQLFLGLASMAVRYTAVLREEAQRLAVSRRSRCYRPRGSILHRQTRRHTAQMVGMLLLRAYDRSERIYWAMLSRGYRWQQRPASERPLTSAERWELGVLGLLVVSMVLVDRQVIG